MSIGEKAKDTVKKAAKVKAHVDAGIATGGLSLIAKKLFKKNNTNVTKASKWERRERVDAKAAKARHGQGRSEERQTKIDARRAKIDARDNERYAKNEKARERVNKQIERRNERKGRNDPLYSAAGDE